MWASVLSIRPEKSIASLVARLALLQIALLSFCCFLLVLIPPSVCGRWQALHGPLRQDSLRGMGTGFEHEQYLI